MSKAAKRAGENYIEAGYGDKVVFRPKKKPKAPRAVVASWQRSQGLWAAHRVFQGMTVREVIEWLRGDDCDV